MKLNAVTYVVRDYDEAIKWFIDVLGFELREDVHLGEHKRWVCVAAPNSETCLLLAKAGSTQQLKSIGQVAGGRVGFFLHVENFTKTHALFTARGVHFREKPRYAAYGTVAVFDDLYGNGWDLIGPPIARTLDG